MAITENHCVSTIVRLAASFLMMALLAAVASARAQDRDRGLQAFAACAACHTPDQNGIGPRLAGVVGRASGSVEGFRYSRAMKNVKIVWDAATLDAYLTEPQKIVPGNLMPFSGITDPQRRADVIAYLRSLKPKD
jgi:cytochrome c